MGKETVLIRSVTLPLAVISLSSAFSVILLMPTQLLMLLSTVALLPATFTLLKNSRKAALAVDMILLAPLIVSHLQVPSQILPASPLDIVRLILIFSFHEFSSIFSSLKGLEASYRAPDYGEVDIQLITSIRGAFLHRSLFAGGILLATTIISEIYYFAAQGVSASLYSIYGVSGGLMVVIAFLFLLLSKESGKPSS